MVQESLSKGSAAEAWLTRLGRRAHACKGDCKCTSREAGRPLGLVNGEDAVRGAKGAGHGVAGTCPLGRAAPRAPRHCGRRQRALWNLTVTFSAGG